MDSCSEYIHVTLTNYIQKVENVSESKAICQNALLIGSYRLLRFNKVLKKKNSEYFTVTASLTKYFKTFLIFNVESVIALHIVRKNKKRDQLINIQKVLQ